MGQSQTRTLNSPSPLASKNCHDSQSALSLEHARRSKLTHSEIPELLLRGLGVSRSGEPRLMSEAGIALTPTVISPTPNL
jgi:hypothetical protein